MWYEILPCVGIMAVCLSLPQAITYIANKTAFGNPMRRDLSANWDLKMFARDARICDESRIWNTKGLESIPDN